MKHLILILTLIPTLLFSCPALGQDKYAVVVGVEVYDTSVFENLPWSDEDATHLGDALGGLGFQTTVMTSGSDSFRLRPTSASKIEKQIRSVAASCAAGDTLLISLSGHGVQFSDEPLLPSGVRETYFCPSEADLADKASLLKISDVFQLMSDAPATQKLLLVDACQESVLSETGRRKSAKRIELGSVHENRHSVPGGMSVLFSCKSGQFSWQHDPLQHSVFSFHVIRYLRGQADSRFYDNEQIDLSGLQFYVSKRTNDYVIGKGLSPDGQLPVMRGSSTNWTIGRRGLTGPRSILGMTFHPVATGVWFAETEVTRQQWRQRTGADPWGENGLNGDRFPATRVSWEMAKKFCEDLTRQARADGSITRSEKLDLPTLSQWTSVAQNTAQDNLPDIGWTSENSGKTLRQAATKTADSFSLHDLFGNVWEWCDSPDSDKPACGGSYRYPASIAVSDEASYYESDQAFSDIGFRVALINESP
ncbi:caspase family protein [Stieleria varia]|nr:caspase family protein [Stieleria varia]